jgi:hypothetical protein
MNNVYFLTFLVDHERREKGEEILRENLKISTIKSQKQEVD